jgi:hypothetical protein
VEFSLRARNKAGVLLRDQLRSRRKVPGVLLRDQVRSRSSTVYKVVTVARLIEYAFHF